MIKYRVQNGSPTENICPTILLVDGITPSALQQELYQRFQYSYYEIENNCEIDLIIDNRQEVCAN